MQPVANVRHVLFYAYKNLILEMLQCDGWSRKRHLRRYEDKNIRNT